MYRRSISSRSALSSMTLLYIRRLWSSLFSERAFTWNQNYCFWTWRALRYWSWEFRISFHGPGHCQGKTTYLHPFFIITPRTASASVSQNSTVCSPQCPLTILASTCDAGNSQPPLPLSKFELEDEQSTNDPLLDLSLLQPLPLFTSKLIPAVAKCKFNQLFLRSEAIFISTFNSGIQSCCATHGDKRDENKFLIDIGSKCPAGSSEVWNVQAAMSIDDMDSMHFGDFDIEGKVE